MPLPYYSVLNNKLHLLNDVGTACLGVFAPGTDNIISNSQGSLYCLDTSVAKVENTLTIMWGVTSKAA